MAVPGEGRILDQTAQAFKHPSDTLMPSMPGVDRRLELLGYLGVALVVVLPAALRPAAMVGDGADAFGTWWFFWWIRIAVENFGDPSFTGLFFHPFGKDIFAHTGNNFVDAVLSVPLQWVLGDRYFPTWVFLVLVGNALCFRPLAIRVLGPGFPAAAATLLWMSNPAILFEVAAGRPTQAMVWALPAAVYFLLGLGEGEGRVSARRAVWLGVSVAVAGWIYWFSVYFVSFLLLPLWLGRLWDRRADRAAMGRLVRELAIAVGVALILVLPAAIPMIGALGGGRVPGSTTESANEGGAVSFGALPAALANNVPPEGMGLWKMEADGEPLFTQPAWAIGLLLGVLAPSVLPGRRRWALTLPWLAIWALGAVIPWSETLQIRNLPYLVLYHLDPFFHRLWFPYRLAIVGFIPVSLLVAGWIGAHRGRFAALFSLGLLGLSARGLWPAPAHDVRPPAIVSALSEQPGGVITLPMRMQSDLLMWQTRFQRPTFGGMGESAPAFWPPGFKRLMDNDFVRALRMAPMDPAKEREFRSTDRAVIEELGYRWVLLRLDLLLAVREARGPDGVGREVAAEELVAGAEAVSRVLGEAPTAMERSTILWDLHGGSASTDPAASWSPARLDDVAEALVEGGR